MKFTLTSSLILLSVFSTSLAYPAGSPWNERDLALERRQDTTTSAGTEAGSSLPVTTTDTNTAGGTQAITTLNPETVTDTAGTQAATTDSATPSGTTTGLLAKPPTATTVGGAVYSLTAECLVDNQLLQGVSTSSEQMTPDECVARCGDNGSKWAALEGGSTCKCAKQLLNPKVPADPASCNTACSGNPGIACGGQGVLTLYVDPNPGDFTGGLTPKPNGINDQWQHTGCFLDTSRVLTASSIGFADNTVNADTCTSFCQSKNLNIAGLVNGGECRCGATPPSKQVDQGDCGAVCPAAAGQSCGGTGDHFDIYTFSGGNSASVTATATQTASATETQTGTETSAATTTDTAAVTTTDTAATTTTDTAAATTTASTSASA